MTEPKYEPNYINDAKNLIEGAQYLTWRKKNESWRTSSCRKLERAADFLAKPSVVAIAITGGWHELLSDIIVILYKGANAASESEAAKALMYSMIAGAKLEKIISVIQNYRMNTLLI